MKLLAICALAFVLRLAAIAMTLGFDTPAALEPSSDSRMYITLAQSLLDGRGFAIDGSTTAVAPPLYIVFLAALYGFFDNPAAVRIVQALLGSLTCLLVYEIARRLLDRGAGLRAAFIWAAFPHAVYISGLHLTENLFLLLVSLVVLQGIQVARSPGRHAAVLGGLVGLTALTRSAFLAFLPVLWIWGLCMWGMWTRTAWRVISLVTAGMLLVLVPWTLRNMFALDAIVPVQSNSGMVFWAANNPHSNGGLAWPDAQTWQAGPPPNDGLHGWRELSIQEENRLFITTAVRWISDHPREFAILLAKKLERLYGFSKAEGSSLTVPRMIKVAYAVFMAAAILGMVIFARDRSFLLLLLVVIFTNATVLLFSGGSRYLISMLPALAVFGGAGWHWAERKIAQTAKWDRVPVGT